MSKLVQFWTFQHDSLKHDEKINIPVYNGNNTVL